MIVPCLTKEPGIVFGHNDETCSINCVYAISEMNISDFDEIYFIVLQGRGTGEVISSQGKVLLCPFPADGFRPAEPAPAAAGEFTLPCKGEGGSRSQNLISPFEQSVRR